MRTLYLECNMGAAGDMLMAALLELIPDQQAFVKQMNALGLPGVQVKAEQSVKCGITGTHVRVAVHGEEEDQLAMVMMKHTTTLGIRRQDMSRYILNRTVEMVETADGPVRVKTASGMGVRRQKAEYDDLAALAERQGISLREARQRLSESAAGIHERMEH